jgi:hypothetical protein
MRLKKTMIVQQLRDPALCWSRMLLYRATHLAGIVLELPACPVKCVAERNLEVLVGVVLSRIAINDQLATR